jgi:dolichyl-phosphate-mannose--protein O-mannosyl transferase
MGRPTSFFYETPKGCGAQSCSQEILALGTPLLWWSATVALMVVVGLWIRGALLRQFDPAITIIIAGMAAGYMPWYFYQSRTVFTFYAIVFEPFLILALVYCAHMLLIKYGKLGKLMIGGVFLLIALNFIYFLPLYMGDVITYEAWRARMWFPSWI